MFATKAVVSFINMIKARYTLTLTDLWSSGSGFLVYRMILIMKSLYADKKSFRMIYMLFLDGTSVTPK